MLQFGVNKSKGSLMKALSLIVLTALVIGACGKTDRPTRHKLQTANKAGRARAASASDAILGTWIANCERFNNNQISANGKITFKEDGTTTAHTDVYLTPNCLGHAFYKATVNGTYEAKLMEDSEDNVIKGQVIAKFNETSKNPGGLGKANIVIQNSRMEAHLVKRVLLTDGKETPINREDLTDFTFRKQKN